MWFSSNIHVFRSFGWAAWQEHMKSLAALSNAEFQEQSGKSPNIALKPGRQLVSVHLLSMDAGGTAGWRSVSLHAVED